MQEFIYSYQFCEISELEKGSLFGVSLICIGTIIAVLCRCLYLHQFVWQ